MRDIAVTLAVFGSLPFILKRPWIGILVWTWLGFMNPHRLAWGFSVNLPFAMIVALTTMAGMLSSKEEKKIPWTREIVLLVVFWGWTLITTLAALYPALAWQQLDKVSKIFLMIVAATMLISTPERLKALVWVIALSIGFFGVKGGIFTLTTGGGHRVLGPANSFIAGNNEIGLALCMTVPLLYFFSQQAKRVMVRYALLGAAVLSFMAALGTQSRGALLGVSAMGAVLWLKSRRKIQVGILLVVAALLLVPLMPEKWSARMATIQTYEQDKSAMTRINAWWTAFNLASSRLTGGGFETFQPAVARMYAPDPTQHADAHSIYFEVLGEHGFPGLAIFLTLAASTWLSASAVARGAKRKGQLKWLVDLMRMVQVSLAAYLAAGAFLGMAYFDYYYNLVLIVAVARTILARHVAGEPATVIRGGATPPAGQMTKGPPHSPSPATGRVVEAPLPTQR